MTEKNPAESLPTEPKCDAVLAYCALPMRHEGTHQYPTAHNAEAAQGAAPRAEGHRYLGEGSATDPFPDRINVVNRAAPRGNAERAEGLDVERLAEVTHRRRDHPLGGACDFCRREAAWIAREYLASRPSDEGEGTARANCSRFRHDEHCDHD